MPAKFEPRHDKTNKMTVRPAKTQISLCARPVWSVFAVRMKKAWVLSYPLSAQRRLWSDWAHAQVDLSLHWAHTQFVGFLMSRLKYQANEIPHKREHGQNIQTHHATCHFTLLYFITRIRTIISNTHTQQGTYHHQCSYNKASSEERGSEISPFMPSSKAAAGQQPDPRQDLNDRQNFIQTDCLFTTFIIWNLPLHAEIKGRRRSATRSSPTGLEWPPEFYTSTTFII